MARRTILGVDPDELVTSVSLVTLLDADGTPTDERRWDRRLRIDGEVETGGTGTVWLRLADGERGLWMWIAEHVQAATLRTATLADAGVICPIALEHWREDPERGWTRHVLPRLHVQDVGDRPPESGWPVWTWHGVPNPNWPDERLMRESAMAWETVPEGRPADAPPALRRRDLDRLAEVTG